MARGCLLEETFLVDSSSNGVPRLHGINIRGALTNRVTSIAARSKSVYQQRSFENLRAAGTFPLHSRYMDGKKFVDSTTRSMKRASIH